MICSLSDLEQDVSLLEQDVTDVDPSEAPPIEQEPSKARGKPVLVESELRRSPRIQNNKKGFHSSVCKVKQCLGCESAPPSLSPKVIRNICTSLCDVDIALVGDEALKKKRKTEAPIGAKHVKKPSADVELSKADTEKKSGGSKSKTNKKKSASKDAAPEEKDPKK